MDATFWHYTLAFPLLILLGTLVHCLRAWPNFVPDRQDFTPGNPLLNYKLNDMMSANYGFMDYLVGTDYDEEGFYEFFSRRNWRNMCLWTTAIGYTMLLSFPELLEGYVSIVNQTPAWLWNLLLERVKNLRLI